MGFNLGHARPLTHSIRHAEALGNAMVVVEQSLLDDQIIDVVGLAGLFHVLRQRVEGELHPLTRRQGQQILRHTVPQAAHRFLREQQKVDGVLLAELEGDLVATCV